MEILAVEPLVAPRKDAPLLVEPLKYDPLLVELAVELLKYDQLVEPLDDDDSFLVYPFVEKRVVI